MTFEGKSETKPELQHRTRRVKKEANPLRKGILSFCETRGIQLLSNVTVQEQENGDEVSGLRLSTAVLPKRYTIYPPLLLLPFNFTTHNAQWKRFYDSLSQDERQQLFRCLAEDGFTGMGISRIAINAPIAAEENEEVPGSCNDAVLAERKHNFMRSPSGLVPLYGEWGPSNRCAATLIPTVDEFEKAFWVTISQHKGVTQCWAPLYTMFSRGNISEKARILGIDESPIRLFPGLTQSELQNKLGNIDVVDMYVGIGYFAFSYLKRGVRRVWGWDINAWSIEGLRRGCELNGWGCLVLKISDEGELIGTTIQEVVEKIANSDMGTEGQSIKCVVFLGDNKWARKLMEEMHTQMEAAKSAQPLNVRHANLGLLPTSEASWQDATTLLLRANAGSNGGWLHVHENVDIRQIEAMAEHIVRRVTEIMRIDIGTGVDVDWLVSCSHVEQVKTFAPGVMHCVFDICMMPRG